MPRRLTADQRRRTWAQVDVYPSDHLVSMLFAKTGGARDTSAAVNGIIREVLLQRGCYKAARARSTGTAVEVWRADALGVQDDGGDWVTVCEHGSSCHHETLKLAMQWSSAPEIWCETGCRDAYNERNPSS